MAALGVVDIITKPSMMTNLMNEVIDFFMIFFSIPGGTILNIFHKIMPKVTLSNKSFVLTANRRSYALGLALVGKFNGLQKFK